MMNTDGLYLVHAFCPECDQDLYYFVNKHEEEPEPSETAYCDNCEIDWQYAEVDTFD
jgi:uncharacterized protein YbaR (Trm112 family)